MKERILNNYLGLWEVSPTSDYLTPEETAWCLYCAQGGDALSEFDVKYLFLLSTPSIKKTDPATLDRRVAQRERYVSNAWQEYRRLLEKGGVSA